METMFGMSRVIFVLLITVSVIRYNRAYSSGQISQLQSATMSPAVQGTGSEVTSEMIDIAPEEKPISDPNFLSRIRNRYHMRRNSDTSLIADRISNQKIKLRSNSAPAALIAKTKSFMRKKKNAETVSIARRKRRKNINTRNRIRNYLPNLKVPPITPFISEIDPIQKYANTHCQKVMQAQYVYRLKIAIQQMKAAVDAYLVYDVKRKEWRLLIIPDLYLKKIWAELKLFTRKKGITQTDLIKRKDALFDDFCVNDFGGAEITINPVTLIAHVDYIEAKGLYSKPNSDIGLFKGARIAFAYLRGNVKVLTIFNDAIEDVLRKMGVVTIECDDQAQLTCNPTKNPFGGEQVDMFPLRVWQNKKGKFSYYMSIGYHTRNDARFEMLCSMVSDLKWGELCQEVVEKVTHYPRELKELERRMKHLEVENELHMTELQQKIKDSNKLLDAEQKANAAFDKAWIKLNKRMIFIKEDLKRAQENNVKIARFEEIFKAANERTQKNKKVRMGVAEFKNPDIRQQRLGDLMILVWNGGKGKECQQYVEVHNDLKYSFREIGDPLALAKELLEHLQKPIALSLKKYNFVRPLNIIESYIPKPEKPDSSDKTDNDM